MPPALSQSLVCTLALFALTADIPTYARSQSQDANAARPQQKSPSAAKIFDDVPYANPNYARLQDLQQKGTLIGYPEGYFSGKRLLTRYQFTIAIKRVTDSMNALTLTPDGNKLQPTFGLPNPTADEPGQRRDGVPGAGAAIPFPVAQALEMLAVWREFQPELIQIGVTPAVVERVRKTLEIYVAATGADLPLDFRSAFQAIEAAYARRDIEGVLRFYAPDCGIIEVQRIYHFTKEGSKTDAGMQTERVTHDLAWQREELKRLFFTPRPGFPTLPVRAIRVTSSVQQSSLNPAATELRLTVERKIHLDQGQAQTTINELDEEVWVKGVQGWKLKRRTITPMSEWTDYS